MFSNLQKIEKQTLLIRECKTILRYGQNKNGRFFLNKNRFQVPRKKVPTESKNQINDYTSKE
ncbi:MAG: hypothetical protein A2Y41_05260 [Spirochaetes bacterium GWB1_36_13]|nr:MAG: hypothetical protein A2Y41_05260 [Spirochaetes bacterium GWB1_36_13]